jgi:predicted RNA-binding protein with PUA domain
VVNFLKRFFVKKPVVRKEMCIRCDEWKEDVPFIGARCRECERVVTQIALTEPQGYSLYLKYVKEAREGRRS